MATIKCRVRPLTKVFHVGTFDPKHKGVRGSSHEGRGMSVSLHPDAWIQIAKLGGLPTFALTKEDGKFLDYHSLMDRNRKSLLFKWAKQRGIATLVTGYKVEWYDEEYDQKVHFLFDNKAEAEEEVDFDESKTLKAVKIPSPSDEALEKCGYLKKDGPIHAWDVIAMMLAYEKGLDGVWWNDVLDPDGLSAPRGVIFPEKLDSWKKRRVGEPKLRNR